LHSIYFVSVPLLVSLMSYGLHPDSSHIQTRTSSRSDFQTILSASAKAGSHPVTQIAHLLTTVTPITRPIAIYTARSPAQILTPTLLVAPEYIVVVVPVQHHVLAANLAVPAVQAWVADFGARAWVTARRNVCICGSLSGGAIRVAGKREGWKYQLQPHER
jgi:hypothetical protein